MGAEYKVGKGLVGGYTVSYACPRCSTALKSPLAEAGQADICPECNSQFVVPGVKERDDISRAKAMAADAARKEKELAAQKEWQKQAAAARRRDYELRQATERVEVVPELPQSGPREHRL